MTLLSSRHPLVHPLALRSSPAATRLLFAGLLVSPALFLVSGAWWPGPLALGVVMVVAALAAWRDRGVLPEEREAPVSRRVRALEIAGIVVIYAATLLVFRNNFDIWEQWTWTMHTEAPWDGFESGQIPSVAQVLRDQPGRWHGPHITHGLLHSRPMILALTPFVHEGTTRPDLASALRVVNTAAALLMIPLLYRGFRHVGLLPETHIATAAALLSPGILMVASKGHWLGLSYGVACLAIYALARFLKAGSLWALPLFLAAWTAQQALYSSAVLLVMVLSAVVTLYSLVFLRPLWAVALRAALAAVPAAALLVFVAHQHPDGLGGHFSGNGETLFQIEQNELELNRFAGYWSEIAPRYGVDADPSRSLFQRAGLGMAARNMENGVLNLFGTGSFYAIWQAPNEGRIKSMGFVLPWLLVSGAAIVAVRARGRVPAALYFLAGGAVLLFGAFLLTWDLSAHRLFGINLIFAAMAGAAYSRLCGDQPIFGPVSTRHVLFTALWIQAAVLVQLDWAGHFIGAPYR